jgi:hypothetical protein
MAEGGVKAEQQSNLSLEQAKAVLFLYYFMSTYDPISNAK